MKISQKKALSKYIPILIALMAIAAIAGFVAPEYENIKARMSAISPSSDTAYDPSNLWTTAPFPSDKVFVAVSRINGMGKIKSIAPSDCGISVTDAKGNIRNINPLGIILSEYKEDEDSTTTFGPGGTVVSFENEKRFVVRSEKRSHTVRTAGVVNTVTVVPETPEDPGLFAIGTNAKRLWLVRITPKGYRYSKKRLPGAPVFSCFMDGKLYMLCANNTCIFSWDPATDKTHIVNLPEGFFDDCALSRISDLGFMREGENDLVIIDKSGKTGFVRKSPDNELNEYFTSPMGRYLAIIGISTIESHGKSLNDGYSAIIDLTIGKKIWETEYLINSERLIGVLEDGDALCYDPAGYTISRKSGDMHSSEKLLTLPCPVSTLVRNNNSMYILCGGELWIIRQIAEGKGPAVE
ncbi:MAG: hypothetical protein IK083_01225 [Abditibacteriota bacterium]|nr:hypothetical protein [Abditibacteriota bacterium]